MSVDRKIHLKPFIKMPVQYKAYEKEINTCGEHENYSNDKFCPLCGKEIKFQRVPINVEIDSYELIGNGNFNQYVENGVMYLFSNTKSKSDIGTHVNVFKTITPELIDCLIAEFSDKHKEDIKILEAKTNSKLKVEFGFLYEVW